MLRPRALLFAAYLVAACLVAAIGCKESGNDYYAEGLRLLGEAERGDCKLGYDRASGQQIVNSRRITTCLQTMEAGLAQLERARELGVTGREIDQLIAKTEAQVARLESMLRMVGRMEYEPELP